MLIYKITNKINGKIYVGQTRRKLKSRINGYRAEIKTNPNNKQYIIKSMKKYGFENFEFSIIEDNIQSPQELDEKEIYWIAFYNSIDHNVGYNLSKGGNGIEKFTEETKKKIAAAHKGTKHSEETKAKIRVATIAHFSEPENRERLSKPRISKPRSNKAKKKISEANKNRIFSKEEREKISLDNKNRVWTEEMKLNNAASKCKFDYRQAQDIRDLYNARNITKSKLAKIYECSYWTINNIISGKSLKLEEHIRKLDAKNNTNKN